jgi:hypothetical protein
MELVIRNLYKEVSSITKHNRSLKVALQGSDFCGPPLMHSFIHSFIHWPTLTLQTCIREVLLSTLGQNTAILTNILHGVPHLFKENIREVTSTFFSHLSEHPHFRRYVLEMQTASETNLPPNTRGNIWSRFTTSATSNAPVPWRTALTYLQLKWHYTLVGRALLPCDSRIVYFVLSASWNYPCHCHLHVYSLWHR